MPLRCASQQENRNQEAKMEKLNVLVLFGGQSTEHDVSLVSAANIIDLLDKEKYNVIKVGITREGIWHYYEGDTDSIRDESYLNKNVKKAVLSPDSSDGLIVFNENGIENIRIDVVFPALHGKYGEDGTIQGLCELAKVPCVGPGMLGSAICMDKPTAKLVFRDCEIKQADWVTVFSDELENIEEVVAKIEAKFEYPVFIKPANAGSSVGIGKSHNKADLKEHLLNASKVDSKILVEEFIDGREVECAVIGNNEPFASVLGEIISSKEFYDYEAKYVADSKLVIPAILSERKADEVRETAIKVFKAMNLKGMSRVDFFVHKVTGEIYLNEINTIPGFTGISMYPMLLQHSGYGKEEIVDKLIELAIENFAE